jgi:hypothetical protein
MISKWFKLKSKAMSLRKRGVALRHVETALGIPRSTLSYWFRNVKLSKEQKKKLLNDSKKGLLLAQKRAALWHIEDRNKRRKTIRQNIKRLFSSINIDRKTAELLLATFYLAEGTKKESCFIFANSNFEILKGLINLLRFLYNIDELKFRCCLHLRKDQNEEKLKSFWSKKLNIPKSKFLKTQFDKRTIKKSYNTYKGVCVLHYYDMALQRRILYLGDEILKNINNLGD